MIYKGFQILTPGVLVGFLAQAVDVRKDSQTFGDTFSFGIGWPSRGKAIRVTKKEIRKILEREKE